MKLSKLSFLVLFSGSCLFAQNQKFTIDVLSTHILLCLNKANLTNVLKKFAILIKNLKTPQIS